MKRAITWKEEMGNPRAQASRSAIAVSQPVYHWTDMGDFDAFEHTNDIGFHFGSRETALERAIQVRGPDLSGPEERLVVAQLDVRNPLKVPDLNDWNPVAVVRALQEAGVLDVDLDLEDLLVDLPFVERTLAIAGYDSIRYDNECEGGGSSWIVFDPNKIHIAAREHLTPEN